MTIICTTDSRGMMNQYLIIQLGCKSVEQKRAREEQKRIKEEQECDYQDLLATSEPDDYPIAYYGPPIGYSAKIVVHTNPQRVDEEVWFGNDIAPRPHFVVRCNSSRFMMYKGLSFKGLPLQPRDSGLSSPDGGVSLDVSRGGRQILGIGELWSVED